MAACAWRDVLLLQMREKFAQPLPGVVKTTLAYVLEGNAWRTRHAQAAAASMDPRHALRVPPMDRMALACARAASAAAFAASAATGGDLAAAATTVWQHRWVTVCARSAAVHTSALSRGFIVLSASLVQVPLTPMDASAVQVGAVRTSAALRQTTTASAAHAQRRMEMVAHVLVGRV
eukprot:TRINITY_DN2673_c0_g3_i1.p2 TRINITY_DN2673_c0_g3~~TRINITY_DN2673_c0_g3_i1.p2  ORF type:complete len:177 (+),score=47.53 TRINITY_DN2673_c0_g3_i1:173-703(+)